MEDIQKEHREVDKTIMEAGTNSSASSGGASNNNKNRKKEESKMIQHFLSLTGYDRIISKDEDDPHVVFLQEVVDVTYSILSENLPMYHLIPGNIFCGYCTAILVKKGFANVKGIKRIELPTKMGRNLQFVKCTIKREEFCLITTHLESTMQGAHNRRKQLTKAFTLMEQFDKDITVIFGGDLNLRDQEVLQVGGVPINVFDIWEMTGKREDARFTWDFKYNDNIPRTRSPGSTPRFRFDRLYFRYSKPRKVEPVYFELIGFERLKSCHRFRSDHWGLLTHLDIVKSIQPPKK